jgi:hypothetical protein
VYRHVPCPERALRCSESQKQQKSTSQATDVNPTLMDLQNWQKRMKYLCEPWLTMQALSARPGDTVSHISNNTQCILRRLMAFALSFLSGRRSRRDLHENAIMDIAPLHWVNPRAPCRSLPRWTMEKLVFGKFDVRAEL